jgi:pimeloyl-ACP methyl ester carboxylesterase
MQLKVNGNSVYAATGGRAHEPHRPLVVLVHGAGLDHTVWALQSRWLAFHGYNVLAVDLPGHGHTPGPCLSDIGAMANWINAVIVSLDQGAACLIGHSMGSLVALETAARFPRTVASLTLIGAAATMPVHPDLLAKARANRHDAIDMVNLWGFGVSAGLGGSAAPGLWMTGVGERLLERAKPGVLHTDLAACNGYQGALAAAQTLELPVLVISGSADLMTPLRGAKILAQACRQARLVVVAGAGHMLMSERPHDVQAALASHLPVSSRAS